MKLQIKCCRCKHVHTEEDRVNSPDRQYANMVNKVCPRCGARPYFLLRADGSLANSSAEWGKQKIAWPKTNAEGGGE